MRQTIEDIDKATHPAYNHPVGTLELAHLISLDTELLIIMESFYKEYGETFHPSPIVKQLVAAGRLGRKAGKGSYDYSSK